MENQDIVAVKASRQQLILDNSYSVCAHCGLKLTDAESQQIGIGPICKKNSGYNDIPVGGDEIQAFIALAEYPELIQYLNDKYRPQGNRALMNGLLGCCSLNRRTPVHKACCEAIEALGYGKLASTLRKSLASVFVERSTDFPGSFSVRVLKRDFSNIWNYEIKNAAHGVFYHKASRSLIVPIHKADDETSVAVNSDNLPNKKILWDSLVKHYSGLIVVTPQGNFEIKEDSQTINT